MNVLFLDDSCAARAPIAEALLRHLSPDHEAWSAGWEPSHVRQDVRQVLGAAGVSATGLRARSLSEVPIDEIDLVVSFVPDEGRVRFPARVRRLTWSLPNPLSAPDAERREAFEATRDEVERRLRLLLKELG
jgi:arsenate reductase